jgi:hypothetical protein
MVIRIEYIKLNLYVNNFLCKCKQIIKIFELFLGIKFVTSLIHEK